MIRTLNLQISLFVQVHKWGIWTWGKFYSHFQNLFSKAIMRVAIEYHYFFFRNWNNEKLVDTSKDLGTSLNLGYRFVLLEETVNSIKILWITVNI